MSKPELVTLIQKEIKQNGPMTFARFMALALYSPGLGYYSTAGEKIGWQGDFYTSSSVHSIFGELLAKQFIQMAEVIGGECFTLVEVGAGKGTLCHDILKEIENKKPTLFKQLQYVIVEESAWLKEKQKSWLAPIFPDHLSWADGIPDQLVGVVFSNELLDAFPVHRLRVDKDHLQEIYVDYKKDQFVELIKEPSTPELATYLERLGLSFEKEIELEINLQAIDWIKTLGEKLSKGYVLTIDYGYPAPELYSTRRPKGTFLCYHKHKTNEKPYEHLGEQDMTAHLDFTSLANAGRTVGLNPLAFTDQMHFLMGLGISQRMEEPAKRMFQSEKAKNEFLAMKQLMDPAGMGRTFKVLIQAKGVREDIQLDGTQFKAFEAL